MSAQAIDATLTGVDTPRASTSRVPVAATSPDCLRRGEDLAAAGKPGDPGRHAHADPAEVIAALCGVGGVQADPARNPLASACDMTFALG